MNKHPSEVRKHDKERKMRPNKKVIVKSEWIMLILFVVSVSFLSAFTAHSQNEQKISGDVSSIPDLTAEERAFLAGRQIRLGVDSARPPFEYVDEKGSYSGISAGFIEDCAKRLGIVIGTVPGLTVSGAIDRVKSGEVDVVPKVTPTPERGKHLLFTQAYVTFPSVIISRKDARFIGGLDDLHGLKIGVLKGLVVEELLKRDHPQLPLITLSDIKTALLDLSTGKIDVFVDNLGTASYNIEKLGLTNLKIAAPTPYNHDLAFGVRKDMPLLRSALDKALSSMSNQEKTAIKGKWLSISYQRDIDWKTVGPIGAVLLALVVFVVLWNRRLRRAMGDRERVQEELRENARILESRSAIKAKLSLIATELQKSTSFEELAQTFMSQAAPLTGAHYGAFYLLDEEKGLLRAQGGYGRIEEEAGSRHFEIGQGLVGQCALKKMPLRIIDSRGSHIRITWGNGHIDPCEILLLPVLQRDQVLAVIELAAMKPFDTEQQSLLEELMPTVALNLEILRRNLMTGELLAKSETQRQELEARGAALTKTAQEIEDSNKAMNGCELQVIRLKKEINSLLKQMGKKEKYTTADE